MQQGDYSSYNYQYPNPNPNPTVDLQPSSYASAPPLSAGYSICDYSEYSQNYPPYSQNPDPAPPTAPTYAPATPSPSNPNSLSTPLPPYDFHGPYQASTQTTQQPPQQAPDYYPPFDQHQMVPNYAPPNPNPNSSYSAPFSYGGSSVPPVYDNHYKYLNSEKFDSGGGEYFDNKYGGYNGKQQESVNFAGYEDGNGDGIYAYEGGKLEPYGTRDTAPKSSNSTLFDDYGRSISFPSGKDSRSSVSLDSSKIVRAVPKVESQQDVKSGVQKFRVNLLAESGGQSAMDVLCQIGLDGIRMLDPNTSRTLRIYSLENITRCELADSSTLALWSKSSVDIEPRRIRLQSNSYTVTTLLDIVTAATVQLKEMGAERRSSDPLKTTEQPGEKKKVFADWMNLMKPGNEEKDHWVPDEAVSKCTACGTEFSAFIRKHHCRNCGDIFCDKCTHGRIALTAEENAQAVRVCDRCMAEVTQRLSNAEEAANKPTLQSHEDLARKLQAVMEKNCKASLGGFKSDGSGTGGRTKEVACPTCTVHLQVQVPSSGSETIECGVCQHPFLVSSY